MAGITLAVILLHVPRYLQLFPAAKDLWSSVGLFQMRSRQNINGFLSSVVLHHCNTAFYLKNVLLYLKRQCTQ